MIVTLYGIVQCSTVKKAQSWLKSHQVDYHFHDFRKDGIEFERLQKWEDYLGWESMLNKRSTTWRELTAQKKENLNNKEEVLNLMMKEPTIIKRPLLDLGASQYLGFDIKLYTQLFL